MDADAGSVVGGADEFDTGGLESRFDGFKVALPRLRDPFNRLIAHNSCRADTGTVSQVLNRPIQRATGGSDLCSCQTFRLHYDKNLIISDA